MKPPLSRHDVTEWLEVVDLRPGDLWTTDKDAVAVTAVEAFSVEGATRIRVTGRIVRGTGCGARLRTWELWPDQPLRVQRDQRGVVR